MPRRKRTRPHAPLRAKVGQARQGAPAFGRAASRSEPPGRYDHIDTSALGGLLGHLSPEERRDAERRLFRYVELVIEVADQIDGLTPSEADAPERFDYDEARWEAPHANGVEAGSAEAQSDEAGGPSRRDPPLTSGADTRTLVY